MFTSPWLYRLFHRRMVKRLKGEKKTDVVIVGGGISGVLMAYFLLRDTDRNVILLEAGRIAGGATGHNAGVVTGYIERPVVDMVAEFGREKTAEGMYELLDGWKLFDEMRKDLKLTTPIYDTEEKAGYVLDPCLLSVLRDQEALRETGVAMEKVEVAEHVANDERIKPFAKFFTTVSHEHISSELQTTRGEYVALGRLRAACLNSAALCEEMLFYCAKMFPDRFQVYEHSPVTAVHLDKGSVEVEGKSFRIQARDIIVCTNGYALDFLRAAQGGITPGLLGRMQACVGYMAGFYEHEAPVSALAYFFDDPASLEPYYYLATRPSGEKKAHRHSLFCIGGPERKLEKNEAYNRHDVFPESVSAGIRNFLHAHTRLLSPGSRPFHHEWHGVMGYTSNRLRWVGRDHVSGNLFWNIGCNGIGLLPAFMGAKKIARLVNGERLKPSIFDVPMH